MNFYIEYWTDRNLKLYDKDEQRRRIKDWYEKEREEVLRGEFPQVKRYAETYVVRIETTTTEYICQWIYRLKRIQKKGRKVKKQRRY